MENSNAWENKIFSDYKKEENLDILKNEVFYIYATGETLSEAERNFYEAFHSIYQRLLSTESKILSLEEIGIKNQMIFYVKK